MKIKEEKTLIDLINKYVEKNNRKNDFAGKYWYPLNYATYDSEEIISAIESLVSFQTSMGEKTKNFENLFSNFIGARGSIFCNSGSSADLLAISSVLKSLEVTKIKSLKE